MSLEQTQVFFAALYAEQTGVLELCTFDHPRANSLRQFIEVKEGQFAFDRVQRFLKATEELQLGAFFGVALRTLSSLKTQKGDAQHCRTLTALFVDADFKHLGDEETRSRILKFPLSPSMIVHSGGGLHPYWLLEHPIFLQASGGMNKAKHYLKTLAHSVADVVDEAVSEPVRVLRIPGSYNFKKQYHGPRPVALEARSNGHRTLVTPNDSSAGCNGMNRYNLDTLAAAVGTDEMEMKRTQTVAFKVPTNIKSGHRHDTLYKLLRSQKARGISLAAALATCHAENSEKCDPPITYSELDEYLKRVWKEPNTPSFQRQTELNNPNVVLTHGGDLTSIVDRTESALLSAGMIYQRAGVLVHPVKHSQLGNHHVRRENDATVLIAVSEPWLTEQMGRVLEWHRPGRSPFSGVATSHRIDPPAQYARTLLGRGEWRFPGIRAVVRAPTLTKEGRILELPGFDAASGLLVDIPPDTFPPVPPQPTLEQAAQALERLLLPLRGFPFVSDAAKAVAVSAILTALVRPSLQTAPLHGFDSPTAGTGKSLAAEIAGLIATGAKPPALSQGKSPEEDEKRLATVLFAADPVIHLDNCERPISGDFLCSMLSQSVVQARILGKSERRVMPSTALVIASGNNLTFGGDASRRAVSCRMDAGVERPDSRFFDFDCHAEVLATRPALVVAGLTILLGYHLANSDVTQPLVRLSPMGSFTDWDWIRGALVWVGMADPADTRSAIVDNDPRRDELTTVMDLWQEAFGDEHVDVAVIASDERAIALREKLEEVACHGKWSGRSVGWWLRRQRDRVVGGRCFHSEHSGNKQRWRLSGAQRALDDLSGA